MILANRQGEPQGHLLRRLEQVATRAGVVPEVGSVTLHRFRRKHITILLRSGLDLATVQRNAGRSDLASTTRYLRPESAAETQDRMSAMVWE